MTARQWASWLRVAHPIVILVGIWMMVEGHETACMILMITAIAIQLSACNLENQR